MQFSQDKNPLQKKKRLLGAERQNQLSTCKFGPREIQ